MRCKCMLVRTNKAIASPNLFVYSAVHNSRYVTFVFSRRASASSEPSLSLKNWRILKGSPASSRTEGSPFHTLMQKSRNAFETGTPSSVLVESFGSLMLCLRTGQYGYCAVQYRTVLSLECLSRGIKGRPYMHYVALDSLSQRCDPIHGDSVACCAMCCGMCMWWHTFRGPIAACGPWPMLSSISNMV
jgi:hypothetical protein